jgi:gas vesicle protein
LVPGREPSAKLLNHHMGDTEMDDNNSELAAETRRPGTSWLGLVAALLAALLIGCLAGASAMLLLAPQSGKKTRATLQRQGRDLREHTAETVDNAVAQARARSRQISHDVRDQAEEVEKRGQAVLDGLKGS